MQFSILVNAPPYSASGALSAYRFACAVLAGGHRLYRVFFYHDGVLNANGLNQFAQDELDLQAQWADLAQRHHFELAVCIASALRRGVLDANEANRYDKPSSNLHAAFTIVGLGQLVDADLNSDRLVTFGD